MPYFEDILLPRIKEIVYSPVQNPEMLWAVIPIVGSIILMELYYGHHKEETVGWNTAFGNTIVLFFVTANLLRSIFTQYDLADLILMGEPIYKIALVLIVGSQALILMYFNYFHTLPEHLTFLVSSTLPTSGTALLVSILVMSNVPFDDTTAIAAICMLIALGLVFNLVRLLIPESTSDE